VIMKSSRSMASSSGLSQRFLRIISPLLLDSFVQQNSHIGLASCAIVARATIIAWMWQSDTKAEDS
jgi:hypothetical protein